MALCLHYFTCHHLKICSSFLVEFIAFLKQEAVVSDGSDAAPFFAELAALHEELVAGGVFETLPAFSRQLRKIVTSTQQSLVAEEQTLVSFPRGLSVDGEFVSRWGALVPSLTTMGKAGAAAAADTAAATEKKLREKASHAGANITEAAVGNARSTDGIDGAGGECNVSVGDTDGKGEEEDDEDDEDGECVEQEGCPDESDLNRCARSTTSHSRIRII